MNICVHLSKREGTKKNLLLVLRHSSCGSFKSHLLSSSFLPSASARSYRWLKHFLLWLHLHLFWHRHHQRKTMWSQAEVDIFLKTFFFFSALFTFYFHFSCQKNIRLWFLFFFVANVSCYYWRWWCMLFYIFFCFGKEKWSKKNLLVMAPTPFMLQLSACVHYYFLFCGDGAYLSGSIAS